MSNILSIFSGAAISSIVGKYGYLAILILMILESASLPIPSEVLLPLAGVFAAQGVLNFYLILIIATIAGIIGISIDYFIAYFISKDVFYKHLSFFRIKKETLEKFDNWFNKNGIVAVFTMRMVPVLRGLISFPAGFSAMNKKDFYLYSILGSLIWDILLVSFGFYALNGSSINTIMITIAVLAMALYILYLIIIRKFK
ncbi:MAG: DedA family protein [Candidatus Micrarchaeaceae archaeon]